MTNSGQYLRYYEQTLGSRGQGRLGAWFREKLDALAREQGQSDRYALFLPRAFELCGLDPKTVRTVVEIGAGDGWALRFARPGLRRVALDQGDQFAADLTKAGLEFHVCDVVKEQLPFDDGEVDLIVMNHVIEHLDSIGNLMAESRRVLSPQGALYIRTPNIRRVRDAFWEDYTHVRPFTPSSLRAMALAHGFSEIFSYFSDHTRINLDILSGGRWRSVLFGRRFGGAEIEAAFRRKD